MSENDHTKDEASPMSEQNDIEAMMHAHDGGDGELQHKIADARKRWQPAPEPERPDWRCGCSATVTQVECPYHGGAI